MSKQTVFVVVETSNYKGERPDPVITAFGTREEARAYLKELKEEDAEYGVTEYMKDELAEDPTSWEVTDTEDYFYACSVGGDFWIDLSINEQEIR